MNSERTLPNNNLKNVYKMNTEKYLRKVEYKNIKGRNDKMGIRRTQKERFY